TTFVKSLAVHPQLGATLLMTNSAVPSFLNLKLCCASVPRLTWPKSCWVMLITSLGAPLFSLASGLAASPVCPYTPMASARDKASAISSDLSFILLRLLRYGFLGRDQHVQCSRATYACQPAR